MKRILTILISMVIPVLAAAQESLASLPDSLIRSDEFLDTVKVSKHAKVNDYMLVGVNYGLSFNNMTFNPTKTGRVTTLNPNYVSVMFTKYSKLFDILPYCGLTFGVAYGKEGYAFKADSESGYVQDVDGAERCTIDIIEVPFMTQIHVDANPLKFMGDIGVYGGYRKSVSRSGPRLDPNYANAFRDYEHRFEYGLQGGGGIALMFDPIEVHFNCLVRWSWSNLYDPDYSSPYYYRFAYPLDIIATVGVHFQLTKREGRTTKDLKREAKERVYGTPEDSAGKGRK